MESTTFVQVLVCMYVSMYVSMYLCIFIKLHLTAQSGPVILVILCHCMYVCMASTGDWASTGMVASDFPLSPFEPENLVSRDGCGRPVPRQPADSLHPG